MRAEVDANFAHALRFPHTAVFRLEVWWNGVRQDTQVFPDGLPILGGSVKNDGTAKIRRQVSAELPASDSAWNLVSRPGTELRPYRGIQWPNGSQSWVPLGRMEVDGGRLGYSPSGNLSVSGGDLYGRVQKSEFIAPGIATFGTLISTQMVTFLQQALPPSVNINNQLTSQYVIGDKVYVEDRAAAVEEMATALAAEVIFDGDGQCVLRPIPQITINPVWTVDAGSTGVMLAADRDTSNSDVRNVVVVIATAADGSQLFNPVYTFDNNSGSATYAGTDPVNNPAGAGPFGVRPYRITSSAITTQQQATEAAAAWLPLVSGQRSTLSLSSVVNPGLEYGDTIAVQLPPDPVTGARSIELHLVESVTVPLTVTEPQQITTRSRGGAS